MSSKWLYDKKNPGQPPWHNAPKPPEKNIVNGWRFSLKGSPRHYDDVRLIIEADPQARVYFGEALTYERGAGVALWRIEATSFSWLPKLYEWWAEAERVEPVRFTFFLYFPDAVKQPEIDLRAHTPVEVEAMIKERAPRSRDEAERAARRM